MVSMVVLGAHKLWFSIVELVVDDVIFAFVVVVVSIAAATGVAVLRAFIGDTE